MQSGAVPARRCLAALLGPDRRQLPQRRHLSAAGHDGAGLAPAVPRSCCAPARPAARPADCRSLQPRPARAPPARPARPRSRPATTSRCWAGSGCAAAAPPAARQSPLRYPVVEAVHRPGVGLARLAFRLYARGASRALAAHLVADRARPDRPRPPVPARRHHAAAAVGWACSSTCSAGPHAALQPVCRI